MPAPRTLVDALEEAARADTGVWFVDGAAETFRSYAVLLQESRRIAAALLDAGLQRGDLVALILPDPDQFLTALFGASIAGLVPASLYPPASVSEPEPYLAQSEQLVHGCMRLYEQPTTTGQGPANYRLHRGLLARSREALIQGQLSPKAFWALIQARVINRMQQNIRTVL